MQLLQASGVHTLLDLRERRADRLADALTELNVERGLVATVPPAAIIALWIEEATKMAAKLR